SAWDAIHSFIFGIFGLSSFFVGPIIIYIAIMISADRTKATISKRMLQLILMILLISAAALVIFVGSTVNPEIDEPTLSDTIVYAYENGVKCIGGGVIGLVIGAPLLLFGQAGAIIILILVAFVIFMIMTNMSLQDLFSKVSKPIKRLDSMLKKSISSIVKKMNMFRKNYVEEKKRQEQSVIRKKIRKWLRSI
ncbi:MAG: DNA translocase FtsK 4TM domain-containing protein, partial [Ruminiclostridium sp.]|nr:DNA translocase FtsK 4TM domain-containing protein [Ruminiclostridium sp.]